MKGVRISRRFEGDHQSWEEAELKLKRLRWSLLSLISEILISIIPMLPLMPIKSAVWGGGGNKESLDAAKPELAN